MRAEYNKIASSCAAARTSDSEDVQLLNLLVRRLPKGAMVLDAGCGSGYPVARSVKVLDSPILRPVS
ncbi:hypothetical protein AUG19_01310 [archaeon 13_1_20CM_2_54_9]|nr:MAG: hypothetical protein AUG19_01310 [archaeon 13_1_20CM_2_54_9]